MLIRLPRAVSVPGLCRQLLAKRIRKNSSINNLFPHHGPGKRGYEDWYAVSLLRGLATFRVEEAADFLRVWVRDENGETLGYSFAHRCGESVELASFRLHHSGLYYVVVQTDALYTDSQISSDMGTHPKVKRYKLSVLQ